MKFKIRFADQIVGLLTITAFVILLGAVFFLGQTHRWFARDYHYVSLFESADGITAGMPILYKGFTIGKITGISLTHDNDVEASFVIYDTYQDRMRYGTLLELVISPIGLGSSMLLHPGRGEMILDEFSIVPHTGTHQAELIRQSGMTSFTKHADTVSELVAKVNVLMESLNSIVQNVDQAVEGNTQKPLGQILQNAADITGTIEQGSGDIVANLTKLTQDLSQTEGLVRRLVDPDGTLFGSLEKTAEGLHGTADNIDDATGTLAEQMPEIAHTVIELQSVIMQLQDVLEALKNNPLLRNGVPQPVQSNVSGTNARNMEF